MKQQLKKLIANQINSLELNYEIQRKTISYYEKLSDKDDGSIESKSNFEFLNFFKNKSRKTYSKLVKLRVLQKEIKSMTGYTTKESTIIITVEIIKSV